MDGIFSFVLLDESVTPSRIIAARDPVGVTTLYQGWSSGRPGAIYFASELKAITDECDKIISFPPGHVYDSLDNSTTRYFWPSWWNTDAEGPDAAVPTNTTDFVVLRKTLVAAVRKRLMSEVPYGVLLSGGLDSSLIAAIAARETEKIAQAQFEARKKKLADLSSGPSTPTTSAEEKGISCYKESQRYLIVPQRPSRLGLNFTHFPLALKTPLIFLRPEKQPITWEQSIMNTYSRYKKA